MSERTFKKIKVSQNGFVRIVCPDCSNEQITYSRISSEVHCLICGALLARPTGGILSTISETVEEVR